MSLKYILIGVMLVSPMSSQAKNEWGDGQSLKVILNKHNVLLRVDQNKHKRSDAAVTALELAWGLKTKAYIPGKPRQRQKLIENKVRQQAYVKSSRSGRLIDKEMTFRSGSAELNPRTKKRLANVAKVYKRHIAEIRYVNITGHTNDVGSKNENTILSNKRADNVKQELVRQGVPKWVIKAKGFGEYHLLPNTSPSSHLNRRVEYSITKK